MSFQHFSTDIVEVVRWWDRLDVPTSLEADIYFIPSSALETFSRILGKPWCDPEVVQVILDDDEILRFMAPYPQAYYWGSQLFGLIWNHKPKEIISTFVPAGIVAEPIFLALGPEDGEAFIKWFVSLNAKVWELQGESAWNFYGSTSRQPFLDSLMQIIERHKK